MPSGGETGHVQSGLGQYLVDGFRAEPRDLGQPRYGGQPCAGVAVGRGRGGAGNRGDQRVDPASEPINLAGQGVDLVQQYPRQLAMVGIESAM